MDGGRHYCCSQGSSQSLWGGSQTKQKTWANEAPGNQEPRGQRVPSHTPTSTLLLVFFLPLPHLFPFSFPFLLPPLHPRPSSEDLSVTSSEMLGRPPHCCEASSTLTLFVHAEGFIFSFKKRIFYTHIFPPAAIGLMSKLRYTSLFMGMERVWRACWHLTHVASRQAWERGTACCCYSGCAAAAAAVVFLVSQTKNLIWSRDCRSSFGPQIKSS